MKKYTTKLEKPTLSAIFTFLANEKYVEGEDETGLNRTVALFWRGNHDVLVGKIKMAGGVKKAIDMELRTFRQQNLDTMYIIILQGGDWVLLAQMQQEVEDFIRKVIFTVGNYSY